MEGYPSILESSQTAKVVCAPLLCTHNGRVLESSQAGMLTLFECPAGTECCPEGSIDIFSIATYLRDKMSLPK
jgi:hypothetical protein